MMHTRRMTLRRAATFAVPILGVHALWAAAIFGLYAFGGVEALCIPFLPVATVGTAVAFYVGFKNNSAYDRFWEGRKIWGGVVNESRTWASRVLAWIHSGDASAETRAVHRTLIYRHLAWINALRLQLRRKSRFFDKPARWTKRRLENHEAHMRNDWDTEIGPWLAPEEHAQTAPKVNPATHLLARQSADLAALRDQGAVDLFHEIALNEVVRELYALQGKCERIKNTPFPRQYAEYGRLMVRVFVLLVPFGMLDVFADAVHAAGTTLETLSPAVPMIFASALVGWVFTTMEAIGDASEDPFERSMNDVPMNALCRAIERDLLQLLGEDDIPGPEQPIDGLLY